MKTRILALTFAAFTALSTAAGAQAGSKGQPLIGLPRTNYDVFKDVSSQVTRYANFTVFDNIAASVENGTVTLTGRVTMPYKKDDIVRRVSRIDGVALVQDKIGVLPVSPFDDDLRYRIARAIYGHPAFWHYAAMANPPIHIVVENGHVTLTGVVQNNVERALARSLATGFGSFSVTNDLKTDDEAKQAMEKI
jgi:hyperosmotically inducible protein